MTNTQKWGIAVAVICTGIFIYLLAPILTPFLVGAILAYLGNPLVNRLVKLHLPRILAATIVFSFFILVIILFLVWMVPLLEEQIVTLINKIPQIVAWLENTYGQWLATHLNVNLTVNANTVKNLITTNWQQTSSVINSIWRTVFSSGRALIMIGINIVLIPIVTFYLLRDWPKLLNNIQRLIPRRMLPTLTSLATQCNDVVGAFFRGQLLVMLALGVYYSSGLAIIGLDLALIIGIFIAIFSIVPYLGSFIGIVTAVVATLFQFHDFIHVIYVLILFVIGHFLENYVLSPLLIGDRIGLHPVAVIFAIFAGGELFGFVGVLLALPIAAVVMVLLRFMFSQYIQTDLYQK